MATATAYANPQEAQKGLTSAFTPAGGSLTAAQQAAIATAESLVPTTAPATTVSTPVISASPATDLITTQIKPTLDTAQASITAAQQAQKERSIALANGTIKDQKGMTDFKAKQDAGSTPSTPLTPQDQAAQDIANTAEVGYKWAYQKDGTRVQIPVNANASQYGMFDEKHGMAPNTSPTGQTAVETVDQDDGGSVVKFGDGTYGGFGPGGDFRGMITQEQYGNAKLNSNIYQRNESQKKAIELQDKMDQIINGTYPLTPDQQAQIEGVKQQFQRLIDQQTTANQNYQGGVTVAQGLLGLSEYSPTIAMGNRKGAIDCGIAKSGDLNGKMLTTVSEMASAFGRENFEMRNDAYKN